MNLDDALHTFIEEARDLLQQMEEALLKLENAPADADAVNAMFRAAHTIKGSAGLFGLDAIVAFTHVAESVLDRVRGGELALNPDLVAVFLAAGDYIGLLIDQLASGGGEPDAESRRRGQELVGCLNVYLGGGAPQVPTNSTDPIVHERPYLAEAGVGVGSDNWHISLRFGPDVMRYGMDPIACLRYLETLGTIEHIVTLADLIPALTGIDSETCYLGFEISFQSAADKAAIEGAFDFVRESSRIRILPPHSKISAYLDFIRALPEEEMLLGEMLVRCGTLTQSELEAALRSQGGQAAGGKPAQPIGEVLVRQNMVQPKVVEAALAKQKQVKEQKVAENNFIRVDARRLDQLINLVGELIITGAGANLIAQRLNDGDLLETTATMARLVEEVRDSALNLRMVQIGATFSRFQRIVHDMGNDLGKNIQLLISGEDTELDKTVVEKIGDPLTHLVRNSMDHGIEPAEVRVAAGKPAHGTVRLNAYHDSGSIVMEVADDGGGLKRDRILAKAIERGLVAADATLSDRDIFNLIFEPGFSTAEKVSNLSGRGVGMDVVRRNIQALRGTVELESTEGVGTLVRVRLPLTLAIIDGFLVGVGDASYVLPLDMVVECIELRRRRRHDAADSDDDSGEDEDGIDDDTQFDDLPEGEASHYLNLRGEVLPYLRLREVLDVQGEPAERQSVVVVQFAGRKAGLVVDTLVGECQTVIKPLGKVFQKMKGVGGFTIMGSGMVALIIDVPGLMLRFASPEQRALAA